MAEFDGDTAAKLARAGWNVGSKRASIDYGDGVRAYLTLAGTIEVWAFGTMVALASTTRAREAAHNRNHILVLAGNAEAFALRYLASVHPVEHAYRTRGRARFSITPAGRMVLRVDPADKRARAGSVKLRRTPTLHNDLEPLR